MDSSQDERNPFAARYAGMTDGELLKLAARSWELSDEAWDALEDELDRRELDVPVPEEVPQVESPERRNLVLLRRFRDLPAALLAKGKLDSAGVPCLTVDDNTVRMDWLWSNLLGGVKILVDAEDFTEASMLLDEPIPIGLDFEGIEPYTQPRCPNCRSLDVAFEELYKPIAFPSLFIFPLPVHRKGWNCHACGHGWNEQNTPSELNGASQTPNE